MPFTLFVSRAICQIYLFILIYKLAVKLMHKVMETTPLHRTLVALIGLPPLKERDIPLI